MRQKRPRQPESTTNDAQPVVSPPRIIGGSLRGRSFKYSGDLRTRPMKDRTREAVFNLLGPAVRGAHAIDLFAGTGALGFEAISRGAARATFIERHFPTARLIEENAALLGVSDKIAVVASDTFFWGRRHDPLGDEPIAVFCSPPYALYEERGPDLVSLIGRLIEEAAAGSRFIVEADEGFDFASLPASEAWNVREYPPAIVGIHVKPEIA
jgi:16S rRNA (guanine(966)-N(2))-methyltransferase RsmD